MQDGIDVQFVGFAPTPRPLGTFCSMAQGGGTKRCNAPGVHNCTMQGAEAEGTARGQHLRYRTLPYASVLYSYSYSTVLVLGTRRSIASTVQRSSCCARLVQTYRDTTSLFSASASACLCPFPSPLLCPNKTHLPSRASLSVSTASVSTSISVFSTSAKPAGPISFQRSSAV